MIPFLATFLLGLLIYAALLTLYKWRVNKSGKNRFALNPGIFFVILTTSLVLTNFLVNLFILGN